ncbi:hypothetical protein HMPREF0972_02484 [Actinomyces sp. oral taxon 848 str. F0332]|nr:hypothetical protein HMPREF0972_02484 [Actinomyces sp. oral taxon 848 str. F0332]
MGEAEAPADGVELDRLEDPSVWPVCAREDDAAEAGREAPSLEKHPALVNGSKKAAASDNAARGSFLKDFTTCSSQVVVMYVSTLVLAGELGKGQD